MHYQTVIHQRLTKWSTRKAIWLPCVLAENSFTEIFCKWINSWFRQLKIFHYPLTEISLHQQTVIDRRLKVLQQLFSWTSVGPSKSLIGKMIGSQAHLTVWGVPRAPCILAKNSFTENFSKWIYFQIMYCKEFHCPLSKIDLHYQTVIDQRLTVF